MDVETADSDRVHAVDHAEYSALARPSFEQPIESLNVLQNRFRALLLLLLPCIAQRSQKNNIQKQIISRNINLKLFLNKILMRPNLKHCLCHFLDSPYPHFCLHSHTKSFKSYILLHLVVGFDGIVVGSALEK